MSKIRTHLRSLVNSGSRLLFPPFCLHCRSRLIGPWKLLCADCFASLELIDPMSRCPACFAERPSAHALCEACAVERSPYDYLGCCFEPFGAAQSLTAHFASGAHPYLALSLASFLFLQWHRLKWPTPDCIVPLPQPIFTSLRKGYNPSLLLAHTLARLIARPVVKMLRMAYSESGLETTLRRHVSAEGKTLLLVETHGGKRSPAFALHAAFPKRLYALCLI